MPDPRQASFSAGRIRTLVELRAIGHSAVRIPVVGAERIRNNAKTPFKPEVCFYGTTIKISEKLPNRRSRATVTLILRKLERPVDK